MERFSLSGQTGSKRLFEFYQYINDQEEEEQGPHITSTPHRHDFYEIWFFKEGGGNHYIENQLYKIQAHSIHLIAPETVHLLERGEGAEAYLIAFAAELFDNVFNQHDILNQFPRYEQGRSNTILVLQEQESRSIYKLIEILIGFHHSDNHFIKASITHTILSIILPLFVQNSIKDQSFIFLDRFFSQINLHYTKHYSVDKYAELLGVSTVVLNRRVKKQTGSNVSTHIQERIILEAKRLLLNSGMNVKEIAFHLGFKEASYFSNFFAKHTKLSPSSFRKKGERETPFE